MSCAYPRGRTHTHISDGICKSILAPGNTISSTVSSASRFTLGLYRPQPVTLGKPLYLLDDLTVETILTARIATAAQLARPRALRCLAAATGSPRGRFNSCRYSPANRPPSAARIIFVFEEIEIWKSYRASNAQLDKLCAMLVQAPNPTNEA